MENLNRSIDYKDKLSTLSHIENKGKADKYAFIFGSDCGVDKHYIMKNKVRKIVRGTRSPSESDQTMKQKLITLMARTSRIINQK